MINLRRVRAFVPSHSESLEWIVNGVNLLLSPKNDFHVKRVFYSVKKLWNG